MSVEISDFLEGTFQGGNTGAGALARIVSPSFRQRETFRELVAGSESVSLGKLVGFQDKFP